MDGVHKDTLQAKQPYLLEEMDAKDVSDYLFSKKILNEEDVDTIKEERSRKARTRCLLNLLTRKGPKAYAEFLKALEDAGKSWVVEELNKAEAEIRSESKAQTVTEKVMFAVQTTPEQTEDHLNERDPAANGKSPLSDLELIQLVGLNSMWVSQVSCDLLIPGMTREGLWRPREINMTNADQAQLIFEKVLMQGCYEDICTVRRLLEETDDAKHQELATHLPCRQNGECSGMDEVEGGTGESSEREQFPEQESGIAAEPEDAKSAFKIGKNLPTPGIQSIYDFKDPGSKPYGKGLCAIIWNFTQDLPGYGTDAEKLETFFGSELKYKVIGPSKYNLKNLNYKGFDAVLNHLQKVLKKSSFDRFFLYILSHGDKEGIFMSKAGSGLDAEDARYKVDDVIAMFSHENLPEMKDYPKCFFIQACRGPIPAKPASFPSMTSLSLEETARAANKPRPIPLMAPGRDILVCYPSAEDALSWVRPDGSLFLRACLETFRKYYRSDHLLDMMVEVARKVSEMSMVGEYTDVDGKKQKDNVCQMPHFVSALSKKFYLHASQ